MDPTKSTYFFSDQNSLLEKEVIKTVVNDWHNVQTTLEREFKQLQEDRRQLQTDIFQKLLGDKVYLPVNLNRLLWNAKVQYKLDRRKPSNLNPIQIVVGVEKLCSRLVIVHGQDPTSIEAQENSTMNLKM